MAISRIASQDAKGTTSTTSVAATYPGATTSGNLLIASVWANSTTDTTAITNWTKENSRAVSGSTVAVFAKIADGTETTVTATGGNTNGRIHIYEYTGNANPIVIDGNTTAPLASGTSGNGSAVTTTNANDLIFTTLAFGAAVTAPAVAGGFSLRQVDTTIRLADGDDIVTATGTYTPTWSWTTTATSQSVTVGFQANTVSNTSIAQVAATITFTGGTQAVATINNVSIVQSAATITFAGGTQTVATINNVSIAQVKANLTFTGGTQQVRASSGTITLTNAVMLIDGTPALLIASNQRQIVSLQDGRKALRLNRKLYMPL